MRHNLLIVEAEVDPSLWPQWLKPPASALFQLPGENATAFSDRMKRWFRQARARGDRLGRIVLLCREAHDLDVLRARLAALVEARAAVEVVLATEDLASSPPEAQRPPPRLDRPGLHRAPLEGDAEMKAAG